MVTINKTIHAIAVAVEVQEMLRGRRSQTRTVPSNVAFPASMIHNRLEPLITTEALTAYSDEDPLVTAWWMNFEK